MKGTQYKMRKCPKCGTYTMAAEHCGAPTTSAQPAPFKISLLKLLK